MKRSTMVLLTIFFFYAAASPFAIEASSGGVRWYSFDEGIALGKKENKKVYVHFWAKWCKYCKKMDQETFSDSAVVAYLNRNYIAVKVNSDKEREISNRFRVGGLPDNWFVDEKGEKISNRSGFMSPKELLPVLKFIQTDSYKTMSYKTFLKNN